MKTKTIANIMATISLIMLILEAILFFNLCKLSSGIVGATENMPLVISLGVSAGVTLLLDLGLIVFSGVNKHRAASNYVVATLIGSGFVSVFIIIMLFSI